MWYKRAKVVHLITIGFGLLGSDSAADVAKGMFQKHN